MIKKINQIYPENSVDIVFAGHNHQYTNDGWKYLDRSLYVSESLLGCPSPRCDTADFVRAPTAEIIAVDPSKAKQKMPSADHR